MNDFSILGIEGLSNTVGVDGGAPISATKVAREMQANGLSAPSPAADGKGFGEMLKDSFEKVNQNQAEADRAAKELVAGRSKNVHETMLTIERADMSLKLAMQVRNKILEAYREIMRMQV